MRVLALRAAGVGLRQGKVATHEPVGVGAQRRRRCCGPRSRARAEALRQAMLRPIDGPGARDETGRALFAYAHPIFWAAFSLVGDGGAPRG